MHRTPRLAPEPQPCYSHAHALALMARTPSSRRYKHPDRWRLHAARRLEKLCADVKRISGADLPHNLAQNGPGRGGKLRSPIDPQEAEQAARAVGWWQTVIDRPKDFRLLLRVLRKGSSSAGFNSPRNWFPFWMIVQRFKHPYEAESWLGKVLRRADQKLSGFRLPDGNTPRCAWSRLTFPLYFGRKRPRKAAEIVAVLTLHRIAIKVGIRFVPERLVERYQLRYFHGLSTVLRLAQAFDLHDLSKQQPLVIGAAIASVSQPGEESAALSLFTRSFPQ